MTDNEIIKALECCGDEKVMCDKCPYYINKVDECTKRIKTDARSLINRQKAEIEKLQKAKYILGTVDYCSDDLSAAVEENERLKAEVERLQKEQDEYPFKCKVGNNSEIHSRSIQDYDRLIADIQAEAIKEFAEKLRSTLVNTPFGVNCSGETDDYKNGCLRGLAEKQNNVLDVIDNLEKKWWVRSDE